MSFFVCCCKHVRACALSSNKTKQTNKQNKQTLRYRRGFWDNGHRAITKADGGIPSRWLHVAGKEREKVFFKKVVSNENKQTNKLSNKQHLCFSVLPARTALGNSNKCLNTALSITHCMFVCVWRFFLCLFVVCVCAFACVEKNEMPCAIHQTK